MKELTQEQLAALAGTTNEYISQIESGRRNAGIDMIQRISRALGVRMVDLFDGL